MTNLSQLCRIQLYNSQGIAVIFGGIKNGFNIGGIGEFALDAVARPAVNQLVQMGTRGKTWDNKSFAMIL